MSFRITLEAREDLHKAFLYYETERDGLVLSLQSNWASGWRLSRMPRAAGRRSKHKYRVDRFPYGILYRVTGPHAVEVIAVFDLRRKPGSWKR